MNLMRAKIFQGYAIKFFSFLLRHIWSEFSYRCKCYSFHVNPKSYVSFFFLSLYLSLRHRKVRGLCIHDVLRKIYNPTFSLDSYQAYRILNIVKTKINKYDLV